MRFMKTFQTSVLTVLSLSFVLSVTCALQAQTTNTWTNFIGDFRWGTTINWSPNGSPNADGAVADFQVTVPNDISVAVVKANGGTLTTVLSTLKLGDTNGTSGITFTDGGVNTSRLRFTNSTGSAVIEKRGNGNDTIACKRMEVYPNLNVIFAGGAGSLTFNCTDGANQSIFAQPGVVLSVAGAGTLILANANNHNGGTVISNNANVQITSELALGTNPVPLMANNVVLGNGGTLLGNGAVALTATRGVFLKGGGSGKLGTVTGAQTLTLNGPISSDGTSPASLTIAGPGTVTLAGANTYTTDTLLANGTLMISGSGNTINNSAALLLASGTALAFNFPAGNPATVPITVGTLSPTNRVTINISGLGLSPSQFPLIKYTSLVGGGYGAFALGSLTPGVQAVLVNNTANHSIDLHITQAVDFLTWSGAVNGNWDINATANWLNGAVAAKYLEPGTVGDAVSFDDTAAIGVVTRTTSVKPAVVIVTNNTLSYTIGGAGAITGSGSLLKSGSGTLTLATANTFSGGVSATAGTIQVGNDSALGTGLLTLNGSTTKLSSDSSTARSLANSTSILSDTTLGDTVNAGTLTFNGLVDLGNGTRTISNLCAVTFAGGSTDGAFNKGGAATLTLNGGAHNWNDDTLVQYGTLVLDGASVTNNGAGSAGGLAAASEVSLATVRLVITNGATVVLAAATADLKAGISGSDTLSTNVLDIAGLVRMPNAQPGAGKIVLGRGNGTCTANLLPGGDVAVRAVQQTASGNVSQFNFAGGTLRAMASSTAFMQGLTTANVLSGGAIIDSAGFDISISQPLLDGGGGGGLTKLGGGTLLLNGANTYTGSTVVDNGTLGGIGTINGPVTINSGAALAPGPAGIFTINNSLNLNAGSTTFVEVDATSGLSDQVQGLTSVSYAGTLVVTNLTGTLANGQSFQIFNASGTKAGTFSSIIPAPSADLGWKFDPATGMLSVITQPAITFSQTGPNTLQVSWNGAGFHLQAQTNSMGVGLGPIWHDYPGGASSPVFVPIVPAYGSVFLRLVSP